MMTMNQEIFDNIKGWVENNSQAHYTDGGLYLYETVDKTELLDEMDRIMTESLTKRQNMIIVEVTEWISVDTRLPSFTGDYLVTDGNNQMVARFDLNHWWEFYGCNAYWDGSDVTHWAQLLPSPQTTKPKDI